MCQAEEADGRQHEQVTHQHRVLHGRQGRLRSHGQGKVRGADRWSPGRHREGHGGCSQCFKAETRGNLQVIDGLKLVVETYSMMILFLVLK